MQMHRYPKAEELNPLLARLFAVLRATQSHQRGNAPGNFFASDDDLLQRVQLPEWQELVRFFVQSLRDTARTANASAWPAGNIDLKVAIQGMWFQISREGAFHDVHTHGNCSWSAVYCVQADALAQRQQRPSYGPSNGVTRFYGPHFAQLGGAFVDLGNAYLQPPHVDVALQPGDLVVFPAWLAHQALPYAGDLERIIISFNASISMAQGSDQLHRFGAV